MDLLYLGAWKDFWPDRRLQACGSEQYAFTENKNRNPRLKQQTNRLRKSFVHHAQTVKSGLPMSMPKRSLSREDLSTVSQQRLFEDRAESEQMSRIHVALLESASVSVEISPFVLQWNTNTRPHPHKPIKSDNSGGLRHP